MKKISLCLIVGNVEEYIERCLLNFAPIADEICIVRAIGNQKPDRTLDIAAEVFGARTAIYENAPEHADWPHVDSFAAARQMSFDMAEGEYCFWCDTDDILEPGSAEIIREHAERGEYACYLFPYDIFGKGVKLLRERMVRKEAARWIYPVHETLDFKVQPTQSVEDWRAVVTHLPHSTKTGSNERNLRILKSIPEENMGAGLLYHLMGELAGAGDREGSVDAARRALSMPDIGRAERYEIFLYLALQTTDPAQREILYHQAYMTDPGRREALSLLACNAMDYGRGGLALTYARQMMATLAPAKLEWNERTAAYGWLGDDIFMQALRSCGLMDEAEAVRKHTFTKYGRPRIALVHATRGRPQRASFARKIWLDMAEHPEQVEHLFVFDDDDEASRALRRMHHLKIEAGGGCVAAWNAGCLATEAPVIVQMSDDWMPPPKWDTLILERLGDTSRPAVLAISDGHRKDQLLCMAICTRAYHEQDGWLFHPEFTGVYSDNYFTDLAYRREQVIEARDLVFEHNHPVFQKAEMDETYAHQNAPERYAAGKETYNRLVAEFR